MSKELIDRIQELLLINASLREELKEVKETLNELLEEFLIVRERLDNIGYRD